MSRLHGVINSNISELNKIRDINELGDCMEVMDDVISFLSSNGLESNRACIYFSCRHEDYIDSYYNNLGLTVFSILERGNRYCGYVIHFVPVCDGFVIDLNANEKIDSADDVLFTINEYKSMLSNMNKGFSDIMKFVIK